MREYPRLYREKFDQQMFSSFSPRLFVWIFRTRIMGKSCRKPKKRYYTEYFLIRHMRSQKLDALRGLALLGMILFHANYLLVHLFWVNTMNFSEFFWFLLGRGVAILFIVISGVSFFLATKKRPFTQVLGSSMRRFILLASLALSITLVTHYFFYEERIYLGIIHFFALASILMLGALPLRGYTFPIGILTIILGEWIGWIHTNLFFFIPLGIPPQGFYSADYYPLIPWLGYAFIGYGITHVLSGKGSLSRLLQGHSQLLAPLAFMGRHSLLLYVAHVPVIYGVLMLVIW